MTRYSLVLLVALAGCMGDAPRENPFDPNSERYDDAGTVSGVVTGIYPQPNGQFSGRAGVRVRVMPVDGGVERVTTTDENGEFSIEDLPTDPEGTDYLVRAEGPGLREAETTVPVTARENARVLLRLDALPIVETQAVRTVHIEQWFPGETIYRLEVEATVSDPDRATDVDSVAIVAEGLGDEPEFRAPLVETSPGRFQATFRPEQLPGGQVQALLGRPLRIEVTDLSGNVGQGLPLALVRVIEQTPLTASPQGSETVMRNPPTLTWRPTPIPFAYTYRVDVNLIDGAGIPNLIETARQIDPGALQYDVQRTLAPGNYFWTLWVVDEAGNRSRSKEAGFVVP
ncbi:carboxypeptidase-like regulatory domain-containing protein [Rubrivirga sp.]|uniref:carboxypeptidase-like regulatory domain-containing protein n=1 Tax=Rubrivirga sp. TaxID=1885344 RepID=UPI003B51BB23